MLPHGGSALVRHVSKGGATHPGQAITRSCYAITAAGIFRVIECHKDSAQFAFMKRLIAFLTLVLLPVSATADCYADYKAKQDDPLRLHYGVAIIAGPCEMTAAQDELTRRLSEHGWTLLTVMSLFDEDGLNERKDSAGQYFLRY